jgi:AcrR family transcriptional regulator
MIKRRRSRSRTAPAPEDTRTRILDAAERLFSERGFDAVSVRAILEAAGVNVALAHYHFGSREGLVQDLLRTRVGPLVEEQLRCIDEADARGDAASLEDVLRAYFIPVARWLTERPGSGRLFVQLQASLSPELRVLGVEVVRPVMHRLGTAITKRLTAHLAPEQFLLRFWLAVVGPSTLASGWEQFMESARRRVGPDVRFDPAKLAEEIVAFTAAGLRTAAGAEWKRGP